MQDQPQTQQTSSEPPEVQETLDAAEAKFDAASPTAEPASERPSWLPEKFKTPEEMAESYANLEQKLSAPTASGGIPEAPKHAEGVEPSRSPLTEELIEKFSTEFVEKGTLTDESLASIEAMGIPRTMADQHVRGLIAIRSQMENEVYQMAGGKEQYQNVMAWASNSDKFSETEQKTYDAAIDSGDQAQISLALRGLLAAYKSDNPTEPKLLEADGGAAPADTYKSKFEMMADMGNPKYKQDPAFRKQVDDKLMRSPNL